MNRKEAITVAEDFLKQISPYCERKLIAGSIRRGKTDPKDIEILAEPKFEQTYAGTNVFGEEEKREFNVLQTRMDMLRGTKLILTDRVSKDGKAAPFGPRYYRITYLGKPIDLFTVYPPADWYTQLVIRTGSADFNYWLVNECKKHGVRFKDGHIEWTTDGPVHKLGEIIGTVSEAHVFALCGIEYLEPVQRGSDFLKNIKHLEAYSCPIFD